MTLEHSGMGSAMAIVLSTILLVLGLPDQCFALYSDDFYVTWSPENVRSVGADRVWQITLTNQTASGFASKRSFLFGSFQMRIKLTSGNSAGVVTAYYFSSESANRDEVDFEFLGNATNEPIILQTNVFWNGTGGREQRHYLWFDPSQAYHNYSIIWNAQLLVILVDDRPIRVVRNNEDVGVPYLGKQQMGIHASIWDGSTWATRGGAVPIDWGSSPFTASFGRYRLDTCSGAARGPRCLARKWWNSPDFQTLSLQQQSQLQWANQYKVYDYCEDRVRYPEVPVECARNSA